MATTTQAAVKAALKNAILGIPGPIRFKGATMGRDENTVSAHVVPIPQVNVGDGMLLFLSTNSDTAGWTAPGWTSVFSQVTSSVGTRLYKRVAQAGDSGAALNMTGGSTAYSVSAIVAFSGTDATDPVHLHQVTQESSSQTTHTTPNVTTTKGGCLIVSLWSQGDVTNQLWQPPANEFIRALAYSETAGIKSDLLITDRGGVESAPGAYGSKTATAQNPNIANRAWNHTVALNPKTPDGIGCVQILYGEPGDEGRRECIWIDTSYEEAPQEPRAFKPGLREEEYTLKVYVENALNPTAEKAEARVVELAGAVEQVVINNPKLGVAGVSWIRPAGVTLQTTEGDGSSRAIAVVSLAVKARLT
jgi:hypothetical protein